MEIQDLVSAEAVIAKLNVSSKKQLLQELSKKAAVLTGLEERVIFDTLLERERLGTTGVGNGIAIPHGKVAGIKSIFGMFARLEKPIDYDAIDDQPVDLVFLLVAPECAGADHLKALARISRLLRNRTTCEKIRGADTEDALYVLITDEQANSQAA